MNKKGFTLAELLGVIVLLGIVAIIAISTTGTNLEEGRQKACAAQERNIIEAMKTYMIDNPQELPKNENDEFSKKVEVLSTSGYLADDFTNPLTNKKYDVENTFAVVILRKSGYIYRVRYAEDDKCNSESGKKDEIEDNVKFTLDTPRTTKNQITVTANASANGGIKLYEFSIDGGTTWHNNGSNNVYTFQNLEDDKAYTVLVRMTTNNDYIAVKRQSAETKRINATINVGTPSGSNTAVTLAFPAGCTSGKYTCSYTKDGNNPVVVNTTSATVNFVGSGTIATEVKSNRNSGKSSNSADITIEYTATFVKGTNVAEIGKYSDKCTVTSGNSSCQVTLPTITANDGCLALGWSKKNGAASGTAAGQKVTLSADDTYYANAKVYTYTLAYNLDSGTHGENHPTTARVDTDFTLNNPTRTGYTFNGWDITNMDSSTHYFGSATSTATSASGRKETSYKNLRTTTGTVNFKATWTINKYTISYNLDGGSYGTNHPTSANYNQAVTINNPSKAGYTFAGWNISGMDSSTHNIGSTTSAATSLNGRKETSYKNLRITAGTVTFKATWTKNEVTITSSKNRDTTNGYVSCRGNTYENKYNYTINYHGSSISSGKMCYAPSSGGSTANGCRNYSDGNGIGAGGYGDACFNSATVWHYHRSTACTYAYAKAANGSAASKYQC